jgi:hypothetical protein
MQRLYILINLIFRFNWRKAAGFGFGVAIVVMPLIYRVAIVNGANFTSASLSISDSRPSQTSVNYNFAFTTSVTTSIKQLDIQICTTATGTCTAPSNFSSGSPTLNSDNLAGTGRTTTAPSANAFRVVVTTPASQATQAVTVNFTGVTNPDSASTWYARITTYSDTGSTVIDGTTPISFATTTGVAASVTVDPSLTFAVNGLASGQTVNSLATNVTTTSSTIPFGTVTTSTNGIAGHSLVVTTNAGSGYTVYIKYTGQLTSGSNTIADHSGSNGTPSVFTSPGTAGFGYTTESTSLSGSGNRFNESASNKYAAFTTSNLEVARATTAVSSDTTKIGYQVGISGTTPAGTYTSTVVLTATPTY